MQNILAVLFEVESEGFQAITSLKQKPVTENAAILQMALVKRVGKTVSVCDSFSTGLNTSDDTLKGGLIGGMLGILGGPIGMLLMGSTGALVGSMMDTGDAIDSASLIEKMTDKMLDGEVALIILANEESEADLDAALGKFKDEIIRYDAATVQAEIEEADRAQREMARQARIDLRQSKKAENKQKAEEAKAKMAAGFSELKAKAKDALTVGTLAKARFALKADPEMRKTLLRGSNNELLIDLDGDKQADIALVDVDKDGNLDRISVDLTGNGYFDLYVDDTDGNGIPDRIFLVDEENDKVEEVAFGPEVEEKILLAAQAIATVIEAKEIIAAELDARLKEMDASIREARKELKKR